MVLATNDSAKEIPWMIIELRREVLQSEASLINLNDEKRSSWNPQPRQSQKILKQKSSLYGRIESTEFGSQTDSKNTSWEL